MAIRITTIQEAKKMKNLAIKYDELCVILTGLALEDYICDNTDVLIPKGSKCAVVLILPDKNHPNYAHQKNMMKDYLIKEDK